MKGMNSCCLNFMSTHNPSSMHEQGIVMPAIEQKLLSFRSHSMLVHESTHKTDCSELPETVSVVIICHSGFCNNVFNWLIVTFAAFPTHHINHQLRQ